MEFGIPGKLFSRGIQRFTYHGTRMNSYEECWLLLELLHFHHIDNIGDCQIWTSPIWMFPPHAWSVLPQSCIDLDSSWSILKVKTWVSSVGFQGYEYF